MRVIGGKYEVVRQLGEGGMGAVYEARHTGTGRRVALKEIIGETLAKSPAVVERFQREARATGAIESQHIAVVLDTGTDEETGHPYLVMEYLRGEDLQQLIARVGVLTEDVALRIVAQACIGLARAHEAGVIHRDIKPANLYLAKRDGGEVVVKLLDFGIARMTQQVTAQDRALTATGAMLGSPLYMSPEQAQDAKNLDQRADLWSLGVVLHEALSGKTPHGDVDTIGALIVAICSKPARPIAEIAPHVSAGAAAIVRKALEIDRDKRYASADEMLADLQKLAPIVTLNESMLTPLPDSVRANVEPRHVVELAATTPAPASGPAMSTTAGVASQPDRNVIAKQKRAFLPWIRVAVIVVGLVVGIPWVLKRIATPASGSSVVSTATAAASASGSAVTSAAAIPTSATLETKTVPLKIVAPSNASVDVDGTVIVLTGQGPERLGLVTGALGSTHVVRIQSGADKIEKTIAITQDGAVPDSVTLIVASHAIIAPVHTTSAIATPGVVREFDQPPKPK